MIPLLGNRLADMGHLLSVGTLVETTAIVSHYSFYKQDRINSTDILERYHGYAAELVCPGSLIEPQL